MEDWYKIFDENTVTTPGLLISKKNIDYNIKQMIKISGDVNRLWPHIKTHKMPSIIEMQKKSGIKKFKCSTIGELKLLTKQSNLDHILLAIQPTKEKLKLFLKIQKNNPKIKFSTLVDNPESLILFSKEAKKHNLAINLWIDINNGMDRTGIIPNDKSFSLFIKILESPNTNFLGLHVYDGNIRNESEKERKEKSDLQFQPVIKLKKKIEDKLAKSIDIVAGGSPTFLPHSYRKNVFLSPGTTLLWDFSYKSIWPESPFKIAAIIVTRIISKPNNNLLCFDLGHKAIASEMPLPRVVVMGIEDGKHISQSEEHLVIETKHTNKYNLGDICYAIPYHICPTVIKYNLAQVVDNNKIIELWNISARDYLIQ